MFKNRYFIVILLMFLSGALFTANAYLENNKNLEITLENEGNEYLNVYSSSSSYVYQYHGSNKQYYHYRPITTKGLKFNESHNFAIPNLEGKEYLGDGWYVYYRPPSGDGLVKYNIYTGEIDISGIFTSTGSMTLIRFDFPLGDYTFKVYDRVGNTGGVIVQGKQSNYNGVNTFDNGLFYTNKSSWIIYFYNTSRNVDVKFKIQIEKGTKATDYQVPYITPLKIDFKGSNQVEYINPYKEQYIEILEPNNVNKIEHELIDKTQKIAFNFSVTNSKNIGLVRLGEFSDRLLFDFTDIKFSNKIGTIANITDFKLLEGLNTILGSLNTIWRLLTETVFDFIHNVEKMLGKLSNMIPESLKNTWFDSWSKWLGSYIKWPWL